MCRSNRECFLSRYLKFVYKCGKNRKPPPIDFLNPLKGKQIYGVPIGGVGCGTIGRSFSGDFCRYQLVPGIYEHEVVEANMVGIAALPPSSSSTFRFSFSSLLTSNVKVVRSISKV